MQNKYVADILNFRLILDLIIKSIYLGDTRMQINLIEISIFQNFKRYHIWLCIILYCSMSVSADWQPAKGPLMTRWAGRVSPDSVLSEYPRPQMVRNEWLNLNGLWEYAILPREQQQPEKYDGRILVPFPVESALSGVMKSVGPEKRLWYRRSFEIPSGLSWNLAGRRILVHFGAVDWDVTVRVNGRLIGNHKGGYDPL